MTVFVGAVESRRGRVGVEGKGRGERVSRRTSSFCGSETYFYYRTTHFLREIFNIPTRSRTVIIARLSSPFHSACVDVAEGTGCNARDEDSRLSLRRPDHQHQGRRLEFPLPPLSLPVAHRRRTRPFLSLRFFIRQASTRGGEIPPISLGSCQY